MFPVPNLERVNKPLLDLHLRDECAVIIRQSRLQGDFIPGTADRVRVQWHFRRSGQGVGLVRKIELGIFRSANFVLGLHLEEIRPAGKQTFPEVGDGRARQGNVLVGVLEVNIVACKAFLKDIREIFCNE